MIKDIIDDSREFMKGGKIYAEFGDLAEYIEMGADLLQVDPDEYMEEILTISEKIGLYIVEQLESGVEPDIIFKGDYIMNGVMSEERNKPKFEDAMHLWIFAEKHLSAGWPLIESVCKEWLREHESPLLNIIVNGS